MKWELPFTIIGMFYAIAWAWFGYYLLWFINLIIVSIIGSMIDKLEKKH